MKAYEAENEAYEKLRTKLELNMVTMVNTLPHIFSILEILAECEIEILPELYYFCYRDREILLVSLLFKLPQQRENHSNVDKKQRDSITFRRTSLLC